MYGKGCYFARDFKYSQTYGKKIFQCLVVVGQWTQGHQNVKVAPDLDASRGLKHDSVVDNMQNPSIFVVFTDNHAYPEYIITIA